MIVPDRQLSLRKYYPFPRGRAIQRARAQQSAMRVQGVVKRLAVVGAACYIVSQPFSCYAASSDKLSGSDDAPLQSEVKDGEDKQPPGFKYTHLWYVIQKN